MFYFYFVFLTLLRNFPILKLLRYSLRFLNRSQFFEIPYKTLCVGLKWLRERSRGGILFLNVKNLNSMKGSNVFARYAITVGELCIVQE